MIVIDKPQLRHDKEEVILSCNFTIEGKQQILWYRYPTNFENYLVTERLDGFVIGLLFLGLKTGNDIKVSGAISARLFYSLNHYLIKALCLANPAFKEIKILADIIDDKNLNLAMVAGTGLSCGVDSFATYYDHLNEKAPNAIGYFTFFNVGSHLDFGGEKARKIFQKRLKSVSDFASKEGKEVISVDSNLSEILEINFQQTHSLRSISCILHLQKLFKNYYYASAYRFDYFKLNPKDTSDSDIFNLPMLSTESTNIYASAAQFSRVERTLLISQYPATYDKLDVCTEPNLESPFLNCSKCYKCMRTQLTLDLDQKLSLYQHVFDLKSYYNNKENYIGEILVKNKTVLDHEVLQFMRKKKYKYSRKIYIHSINYLLKIWKKRMKKIRRKILNI